LVFIDQDVIEPRTDVLCEAWIAHHLRPVEKQIIVIEDVLMLLGFDVSGEEFLEFGIPRGAPWKVGPAYVFYFSLCVDAPRIDGEAGSLRRESTLGLRKSKFVAEQVH
jgi:hypothetical protein